MLLNKRISLSWLLLLFSFPVVCAVPRQFCFEHEVSLREARAYIKDILQSDDQVEMVDSTHCLLIPLENERVELVRRFLSKRYTLVIMQKDLELTSIPKLCLMEIRESGNLDEKTHETGLGKRSVLKQTNIAEQSSNVATLRLSEGMWGALEVNDTKIDLRCKSYGSGWIIEVRMKSDTGYLWTSLRIVSGQEVDLGQSVQNLNHQVETISTQKGILNKKTESKKIKHYNLTIR